ncbi:MAG: hypothetical protein H0U69_03540 [Trueperaceae bacterium]|nr:hypothetical protein [Trueperaceae bacterium]
MLTEFWNDTALPALLSVLSVALTIGTAYAIGAIRAWGAAQQAAWLHATIASAADAVETAVAAVNQTLVNDLRAASADGRLTLDEAQVALDRAITLARRQLGAAGLTALNRALGDNVDQVLTSMVEATLNETKADDAHVSDFTLREEQLDRLEAEILRRTP